jgi:hypothetical protein
MKIELIKETDFAGHTTYFVTIDDKYVSGSMVTNEEKAIEMYEFAVANKGEKKVEIIKHTEI